MEMGTDLGFFALDHAAKIMNMRSLQVPCFNREDYLLRLAAPRFV
jgi:hypothetical protein